MPEPNSVILENASHRLGVERVLSFRPGVAEPEFLQHFPFKFSVEATTIYEAERKHWPTDRSYWQFTAPFRYVSAKWGTIDIPKSFYTDFGSVPPRLHSLVDDDSPIILYPSAPHDFLFTKRPQDGTRGWINGKQLSLTEVNHLLTEAMAICGADIFVRNLVFAAVEAGNNSIRNEFAT